MQSNILKIKNFKKYYDKYSKKTKISKNVLTNFLKNLKL